MPTALNSPRSIFLEAVERHSQDWPEFLDSACGGDDQLRGQVQRLLDAHARLDDFMAHPASPAVLSPDATEDDLVGQTIGRYRLLERIGEGGMGVVYVAEQIEPVRRQVALKLIKPGMDTRQIIARFEAERQALALMDHPHIARILDAGEVGPVCRTGPAAPSDKAAAGPARQAGPTGRPYFVMELVRGLPITEYCEQARFNIRQRLELFITVCQAVQHAHQKGIIHRDLKPSNVLVAENDGQPLAKVIDFGVAKAIGPSLTDGTLYTGFAQMIGTPLYMSPEQAELSAQDVDTRSDVYALGVLLYELLTGTPPITRETLEKVGLDEIRRMIREDEPETVSQRLARTRRQMRNSECGARNGKALAPPPSDIPHSEFRTPHSSELDWIAAKALEKDRNLRYESASALAADVQRYLDDLPIQARPAGWWLKATKWRRRNPVAAITIAAAVLLMASLAAGTMWHTHRLSQSLAISDGLRTAGLAREAVLLQEQYVSDMRLAKQAITGGDLVAAQQLLDRHAPHAGAPGYVGFEWHYLKNLAKSSVRNVTTHNDLVLAADLSPDDRLVASVDRGGEVRICELLSGRLVKSLRYSDQEITCVRFSPDGKVLATAGVDHAVHLWNTADWREAAVLQRHDMTICGIAWSPDGKLLASAGRDQAVHIWDVAGRRVKTSLEHADVVRAVAWSPDGKTLATTDGHQGVRLWATATWADRGLLPCNENERSLLCVAFSPDSQVVACSGYGGTVRLFGVEEQAKIAQTVEEHQIWSLVFLDANRLIAGTGRNIEFWQFDRQRKTLALLGERTTSNSSVRSLQLTNGGKALITATEENKTVGVWDVGEILKRQTALDEWPQAVLPSRGLRLIPDGQQTISVRQIAGGREVARLPYDPTAYFLPQISPDEALVAVPQPDQRICLWNAATWKPAQFLGPPSQKLSSNVKFSPDSRWLAGGVEFGGAGVWDLRTGQWRELFRRESSQSGMLAWSPDGNQLACSVWAERDVEVWDVDRMKRISQFQAGSPALDLQFLNGKTLAVAENDAVISLWDPASGVRVETLSGHTNRVDSLAVSADGRTLASSSFDGTIRLWSVAARRGLFVVSQHLPPPRQRAQNLRFLPDGSLFFTTIPGNEQCHVPGRSPPPSTVAQP